MDSSRRAVEAYWRSRLIDGATTDEDKVAPVYKLEEICELLRSSHVSIVKEVSEYIFKRLDHKSPIVKQKTLRVIKYAVGKSGVEFRREMQRHSTSIRQLFHYKGHPDPLKGDALNKAVRDMAHETIQSIFASEEQAISGRRAEVVGIGSAHIKQGLNSLAAAHSQRKNDVGTYKSPTLRRSLTNEANSSDRYERFEYQSDTRSSSGFPSGSSGTWGHDSNVKASETMNGNSSSSHGGSKSREERLLETIVTSGGVRLQPTRDAIQVFLVESSKLDAVALSQYGVAHLLSHVRMKAICVLESILRKKDDAHFEVIASYFTENKDAVVNCSESPQASLREKSMKAVPECYKKYLCAFDVVVDDVVDSMLQVLGLINGGDASGTPNFQDNPSSVKTEANVVVQLPDLIDTGDSDDYNGHEELAKSQSDIIGENLVTDTPVTSDLFGDSLISDISNNESKSEDPFGDSLISDISNNESKSEDPFAGVSFHTTENSERADDLFSGLKIDNKQEGNLAASKNGSELLDIFSSTSDVMLEPTGGDGNLQDLMAGMSINQNNSDSKHQWLFSSPLSQATSGMNTHASGQVSSDALNGAFSSQIAGMNPNIMFPLGPMQYNMAPGMMLNQTFASNPIDYGAMGNFFTQQQLLAAMSNLQAIGNLSAQPNANHGLVGGNNIEGGYASPLPDIFNPNMPVQTHSTTMASSKKEDTKAFDFISFSHLLVACYLAFVIAAGVLINLIDCRELEEPSGSKKYLRTTVLILRWCGYSKSLAVVRVMSS
ncbi:hypothetical protein Sjap_019612 [Stephania japonica]|uniref:VHS domain-containing protein n=1 Tax=Stephania japonica TaxID=461633 RepID=A0AAP0HUW1_9MAGN